MKKFTQRELAEKYNIPSKTLSNWLKSGKFVPAEYNGARKPCFYHEDQLPKLEELIKTDYFPIRKKEPSAIVTVEPAPVIDTEALIAEPLEEKSLEELAEEANLYTARGDDCLKQGLTFYFAAGRRLNEAKSRLEHGQWQNWLAENFSASADTASNYMKLARRFGESNSETFRNLGLATAIKLLALPEGSEEDFAREQAEAGKPLETQSAREVQKNVREWKQKQAEEKKSSDTTPAEEYSAPMNDSNSDIDSDISKNSCQSSIEETAAVIEQDQKSKTYSCTEDYRVFTDKDFAYMRAVTNELATKGDLKTLKWWHDRLLAFAQEIGEQVLLAEMKLGELLKKNNAVSAAEI